MGGDLCVDVETLVFICGEVICVYMGCGLFQLRVIFIEYTMVVIGGHSVITMSSVAV